MEKYNIQNLETELKHNDILSTFKFTIKPYLNIHDNELIFKSPLSMGVDEQQELSDYVSLNDRINKFQIENNIPFDIIIMLQELKNTRDEIIKFKFIYETLEEDDPEERKIDKELDEKEKIYDLNLYRLEKNIEDLAKEKIAWNQALDKVGNEIFDEMKDPWHENYKHTKLGYNEIQNTINELKERGRNHSTDPYHIQQNEIELKEDILEIDSYWDLSDREKDDITYIVDDIYDRAENIMFVNENLREIEDVYGYMTQAEADYMYPALALIHYRNEYEERNLDIIQREYFNLIEVLRLKTPEIQQEYEKVKDQYKNLEHFLVEYSKSFPRLEYTKTPEGYTSKIVSNPKEAEQLYKDKEELYKEIDKKAEKEQQITPREKDRQDMEKRIRENIKESVLSLVKPQNNANFSTEFLDFTSPAYPNGPQFPFIDEITHKEECLKGIRVDKIKDEIIINLITKSNNPEKKLTFERTFNLNNAELERYLAPTLAIVNDKLGEYIRIEQYKDNKEILKFYDAYQKDIMMTLDEAFLMTRCDMEKDFDRQGTYQAIRKVYDRIFNKEYNNATLFLNGEPHMADKKEISYDPNLLYENFLNHTDGKDKMQVEILRRVTDNFNYIENYLAIKYGTDIEGKIIKNGADDLYVKAEIDGNKYSRKLTDKEKEFVETYGAYAGGRAAQAVIDSSIKEFENSKSLSQQKGLKK